MFRIGEFSKLVRVSARMLRYYDKCGLLQPEKIDSYTGYRLYSVSQIPNLSRIIALRDMGFGVREISEILPRFDDAASLQKSLEQKRHEIDLAISIEQNKLQNIAVMCGKIEKESAKMIYDVELKKLPAVKVLSLREIIPTGDKEFDLWEKLDNFVDRNQIACEKGGYSIYHDEEYKEEDLDVEIAVPVPELKESKNGFTYKELEEIKSAATIRFSGPYENYTPAIEKLATWVEENGYVFEGIVRGFAIASPSDVNSPEDYLTELQAPIKKA